MLMQKYTRITRTKMAQQDFTSIAEIILYPQKSMVSFHSGNPSGITGSEFNSYMNKVD